MADNNLTIQQQIDQINKELLNLRNSHDGLTYSSGGGNVRTVGVLARNAFRNTESLDRRLDNLEIELDYLRENLDELVNVEGVDGLVYNEANSMLFLTKGGEKIIPGVKIVSGSGGGGGGSVVPSTMNVKIESLNDSNTFNLSNKQSAILKFRFTSTELGESTGKCSCTIYRNTVAKETFSIDNGVEVPKDIKQHLTVGRNEIVIECSDIYGNKKQLQYVVNVISLELNSTFNDSSIISEDSFDFIYTQSGEVDKEVHFILGTGNLTNHVITRIAADADRQQIQTLTSLSHGAHLLEVYMTAKVGTEDIESDHLFYELIFTDEGINRPIIASYFKTKEIVDGTLKDIEFAQGSLISIPFIVYDPQSPQCEITLRTSYLEQGQTVTSDSIRIVDSTKQFWNIRNVPVGKVTFSIIYNKLDVEYTKSHTVTISENNINVKPATSGLELFLSAEGRDNKDENYNTWQYNGISTSFTNFNWGTNGWLSDSNGDTCLRLNGDARAEIDFTPFANDFKSTGKTLEFEFAIRNVNNRSAVVIDCFDSEGNQVGIQATADKMFFNSNNDSVFCNYTENQRIRVGFTIQNNSSTSNRFMCVYLNGVLSGIKQYASGDSFAQTNIQKIKLGSSDCGIDVYAIRSYNLCLTDRQMTNNYIADIPNIIDKMDIYGDNDLYENGKLSYKKVKKKLPTVTFIGKMPTYKGDKKKNSVRMIFEHPTKPKLNFDEILAQIDVQGTSSAGYVRKNWKTKHSKNHIHMEGELPAKVFCLKVDYAEATGTHNTQNANLIETFYDTPVPPLNVPEDFDLSNRNLSSLSDINKIRTTIAGFPICIFHLDTDDSSLIKSLTISNLESGEYNLVFSSKGNFNYDKDAEDVFAFNSDYDTECWEFLKNEDPQSFLTPWPEKPLDYWEARYHPDLGDLEDLQDAGNDAAANALGNQMIARFKQMYEWVHSTARGQYNGANQASGEALETTYTDSLGNQYLYDNDEYRLAKFKDEFEQYFNLEYCAIYYVYTFFALMVDQRAKNMFLTYWRSNAYGPNNDETNPGKWYPYFYDNDTSYGISNKGHLDFDYYHQDADEFSVNNGTNVYNGANSVLWCNFRDAFPAYIRSTYAKLRDSGKLTYNKIIDQFVTQGSDQWSAAIYNQDADYKYISVSEDEVDGKVTSYPYLFQVRGNGEQHLEYFVDNRIKFCDSKWKCGDYLNDKTHTARVNIYNPTTSADYQSCAQWDDNTDPNKGPAPAYYSTYQKIKNSTSIRPASTNISITPFSRIYYAVQYGRPSGNDATEGMISKLALDTSTPLEFSHTSSTNLNDFETTIFGARDISSLGDLSYLYPKEVVISNCVKLTDLTIGCRQIGSNGETYYNPNLTTVTTGSNTLLRSIDVSNCPNLRGDLNLSGCINIKKVYAKGSGITSVSLPNGGYVNELVLPNTFNNLILKGQKYLNNDGILLDDFKSLNQLNIDNCPNINTVELLNNCKDDQGNYTVKFMRLTNVDLGTVTYEYLINELATIGGIDADNVTYAPTENKAAYIEGKCTIDEIDGEKLARIKKLFPYLVVYYNKLTLNVVFKNEDGTSQLGNTLALTFTNGNSANGVTIDCPVENGTITRPAKASTDQYHFEFGGWSITPNSDPDITALRGITADTTLYVAFDKVLRSYPVSFYVEDNEPVIVDTYYGYTAQYPDGEPQMPNVSNPGMYVFVGWTPSNENITGPVSCYAQFVVNEQSETIENYLLSEFDYTANSNNKTITLNKANVVENTGRISNTYQLIEDGSVADYSVTGITGINVKQDGYNKWIGCFSEITEARIDNIISNSEKITPGVTHLIEYVVLPESLNTIGQEAFLKCEKLLAINIPKNVSSIDSTAFDRCISLDSITVHAENNTYESSGNCLINKKTKTLLTAGNNCEIPNGVLRIGSHAFWGRHNLKSISIPNTVTDFGSGCFCECFSLTNIEIPNSVTTFGSMCLYKSGMEEITFPENTTAIGMYATKDCANLKRIYIKQADPSKITISNEAFGDGKGLTIYVPWPKNAASGETNQWGATHAKIVNDYDVGD